MRRLLGGGKDREAFFITYRYVAEGRTGGEHEYPMHLFHAGEYAWTIRVVEERLAADPKRGDLEYHYLATSWLHFGEPVKALAVLERGIAHAPEDAQGPVHEAALRDRMGDVYAAMGEQMEGR